MASLRVNGIEHTITEEIGKKKLVDFLREDLKLTGIKNGCGIGACGACTVLINLDPKRACVLTVAKVIGKEVLTIEGMEGPGKKLHPIQQALHDQFGGN